AKAFNTLSTYRLYHLDFRVYGRTPVLFWQAAHGHPVVFYIWPAGHRMVDRFVFYPVNGKRSRYAISRRCSGLFGSLDFISISRFVRGTSHVSRQMADRDFVFINLRAFRAWLAL